MPPPPSASCSMKLNAWMPGSSYRRTGPSSTCPEILRDGVFRQAGAKHGNEIGMTGDHPDIGAVALVAAACQGELDQGHGNRGAPTGSGRPAPPAVGPGSGRSAGMDGTCAGISIVFPPAATEAGTRPLSIRNECSRTTGEDARPPPRRFRSRPGAIPVTAGRDLAREDLGGLPRIVVDGDLDHDLARASRAGMGTVRGFGAEDSTSVSR